MSEDFFSLVGFALSAVQQGQLKTNHMQCRVDLEGLNVSGAGLLEQVSLGGRESQVEQGLRVARVLLQDLQPLVVGFFVAPLSHIRNAQIIAG